MNTHNPTHKQSLGHSLALELLEPAGTVPIEYMFLGRNLVLDVRLGQVPKGDDVELGEQLRVLLRDQRDQVVALHVHECRVQVGPDVLRVRAER